MTTRYTTALITALILALGISIAALLVGVYNNTQLIVSYKEFLAEQTKTGKELAALEKEILIGIADRYTGSEHKEDAVILKDDLKRLSDRLDKLEKK